jgi:hypothetical protein
MYDYYIRYMIYYDENDQPLIKYRVTCDSQFLDDINTEDARYDNEEIELHDVLVSITRLRKVYYPS